VGSLQRNADKTRIRLSQSFDRLGDILQSYGEGQGEYDLHLRLTKAIRAQPAWSEVESDCERLGLALVDIARGLEKVYAELEDLPHQKALKLETLSLLNVNEELRRQMNSLVFHPEANSIHWLSLRRRGNSISLCSAPLNVGQILNDLLFSQKDSVVLTGATLNTEGNFRYLKGCLGIEDTEELLLGSPFDYLQAAMVYLTSDIPEPGRVGYQEAVERALVLLCRATQGRCLILFTSHSSLRATQAAIQNPLEEEDILVLGQGVDGSPRRLLSILRTNPRTVLLGTASFWEGIDVVGEALSVLVMVRLPFSVPSDPIFAARSETFDDPFKEYTIPQAAFKFKQGFGRLIRSKNDRGVMVILDRRLGTRNYGSFFLSSLPPCKVKRGPSRNLPTAVKRWLSK